MLRLFASWIPTLYAFPRAELARVQARLPALRIYNNERGPVLSGRALIAELRCTLTVEASGLFLVSTEDVPSITEAAEASFGNEARQMYSSISEMLHIHMFAHRLRNFLPVIESRETHPDHDEIVDRLAQSYFYDISEQRREFAIQRQTYVKAAVDSADRLLDHWILVPHMKNWELITYMSELINLLDRRVKLSRVSAALYNCRGAEAFFQSFCDLHPSDVTNNFSLDRYERAYITLSEQYQDYGEVIGSHMTRIMSIFLAYLVVLLTIGLFAVGAVASLWLEFAGGLSSVVDGAFGGAVTPTLLWLTHGLGLFVVAIVATYVVVYKVAIRRVAERFLEATNAMVVPGTLR